MSDILKCFNLKVETFEVPTISSACLHNNSNVKLFSLNYLVYGNNLLKNTDRQMYAS